MTISPVYHNTRPEGDLLPQEAAAFDLLEQLGIDYERVSSESADTMEKCAAISEVIGVPVCKNLFLCNRQKTEFYLLLMEPDKPFKTKYLSQQIGSARLSFASAEDLADKLGVSRQTINAIEKGDYNPTIRLCIGICRVLGLTLNDLFWEEEA